MRNLRENKTKQTPNSISLIYKLSSYRRNAADVPALSNRPEDFSPHYRTSICYRPMSRAKLESFLIERQLAPVDGRGGWLHSGLLNRMYFYLDEIMFEGTSRAIPIHSGYLGEEVKLHQLSFQASTDHPLQGSQSSRPISMLDEYVHSKDSSRFTQDTGEGTDEGDHVIRFRKAFPHEELFDETSQQIPSRVGYAFQRLYHGSREWLGLVPVHHTRRHSAGIFLGLRHTQIGFELPRSNLRSRTTQDGSLDQSIDLESETKHQRSSSFLSSNPNTRI